MIKEEFKTKVLDLFLKYVKIDLKKGITFDLTEFTDKLYNLMIMER